MFSVTNTMAQKQVTVMMTCFAEHQYSTKEQEVNLQLNVKIGYEYNEVIYAFNDDSTCAIHPTQELGSRRNVIMSTTRTIMRFLFTYVHNGSIETGRQWS